MFEELENKPKKNFFNKGVIIALVIGLVIGIGIGGSNTEKEKELKNALLNLENFKKQTHDITTKLKKVKKEYSKYKEMMEYQIEQYAIDDIKKIYNTGYTYEKLLKEPEKYRNKFTKLTGKLLQVINKNPTTEAIFEVDGNSEKLLSIFWTEKSLSSGILNYDNITLYVRTRGTKTYKTKQNTNITIPAVIVDKIEINN